MRERPTASSGMFSAIVDARKIAQLLVCEINQLQRTFG
ncbi:hypothetical protein MIZ03_4376 [Rhodoferax lithotrophicus]|uniref:Uncharacterized protein n=1 Tax=Rhodoferax lithotrophicus TaxID=2798804 RepID=A0ABN6D5P2_9BURK|nr:hypothetical protein MIZ03_2185 [Rhodoferax sp. MIZ03]BCO29453.1 hypothetical protein MIZ03_4376 [Rhodoferax sp. MIZ03]